MSAGAFPALSEEERRMFVIVAVVVIGVFFVTGALLGVSVAQNQASDRARRTARDRHISAIRTDSLITQA
jgi:hypothetical protein